MNRLLTLKEVVTRMTGDLNRICNEHGIPEKDRAAIAMAALSGLWCSPPPRVGDERG